MTVGDNEAKGQAVAAPLARLIHLGTHSAPSIEHPRVVLVNLLALTTILTCALWFVVQTALNPATLAPAPVLIAFMFTPVFMLQREGHNYWAAVALLAAGLLSFSGWRISGGDFDGDHLYLLITVVLPSVVFPLRHRWTALILSVLAFVTYLTWITSAEPGPALAGGSYTDAIEPGFTLGPAAARGLVRDGSLVLMLGLIGYRARAISYAADLDIQRERARADALIRGVLPERVARGLKSSERQFARRHPDVSVVYITIEAFAGLCRTLEASALVELLDPLHGRLDALCQTYDLERIKSTGGVYIAVAGLALPREDHAELAAAFAQASLEAAEASAQPLALRVGIDSGAVVAGAIGRRKYSYDIWGQTLDNAHALERSGAPAKIQISAQTHAKINHRYRCEPRQALPAYGYTQPRYWMLERSSSSEEQA